MIIRIILPRFEELFGLDSDDTDRGEMTKNIYEPQEAPGGGYYYHVCSCVCSISGYLDGNFYGMFEGY